MARKNYSEEFRRQAVDLYESTPGATVRGIAEDLGIVRGTRCGTGSMSTGPARRPPPTER
jgi:transposase